MPPGRADRHCEGYPVVPAIWVELIGRRGSGVDEWPCHAGVHAYADAYMCIGTRLQTGQTTRDVGLGRVLIYCTTGARQIQGHPSQLRAGNGSLGPADGKVQSHGGRIAFLEIA